MKLALAVVGVFFASTLAVCLARTMRHRHTKTDSRAVDRESPRDAESFASLDTGEHESSDRGISLNAIDDVAEVGRLSGESVPPEVTTDGEIEVEIGPASSTIHSARGQLPESATAESSPGLGRPSQRGSAIENAETASADRAEPRSPASGGGTSSWQAALDSPDEEMFHANPSLATSNDSEDVPVMSIALVEQSVPDLIASNITSVDAALSSPSRDSDAAVFADTVTPPRQYRPVVRAPSPRNESPGSDAYVERDRAARIEVRLRFERGGCCSISFLPRRGAGLPNDVEIIGSGNPPALVALQDEWYQDVVIAETGRLLRQGLEWRAKGMKAKTARWVLSGREVYVFGRHDNLYGFVTRPRLTLDDRDEQIVICTQERVEEVKGLLALSGSPEPVVIDNANGIPSGWIGFRGIFPRTALATDAEGEILDALRPLADVEIAFEGGIRLRGTTWLTGFPPRVQLKGHHMSDVAVFIDGKMATRDDDGSYSAPGWNARGEHQVWCSSASRSYELCDGEESWEPWHAYAWAGGHRTSDRDDCRGVICGALVLSPRVASENVRTVVVPTSNPILIGSAPGEVHYCSVRSDIRSSMCLSFPSFDPVWALPADPLHSDRRRAHVLHIGNLTPVVGEMPRRGRSPQNSPVVGAPGGTEYGLWLWASAILGASHKRLALYPTDPGVIVLWREYKDQAKALKRLLR